MFELTNEQRRCFALPPVLDTWTKVEVTPSPTDMYYTYAYLDGNQIKKAILYFDEQEGHELYHEFTVDAMLSEDHKMLLPKTERGKPKKFTSSNLLKRTPVGMSLKYSRDYVSLDNCTNRQTYYDTGYEDIKIDNFPAFEKWIQDWCEHTHDKELQEIYAFASQPRIHQKYQEGDFFRFRINRTLYGYGRILLDFRKMRKNGERFWNIFLFESLCVAIYHVVTENKNLTPDQLSGMKMMPSSIIADNVVYYGECVIIGNKPLTPAEEDFPIHYGNAISMREKGVRYQHGRTYIEMDNKEALYHNFRNGGVSFSLRLYLRVLEECIAKNSNAPYWEKMPPLDVDEDLRNPKFRKELAQIRAQVGVKNDPDDSRMGGKPRLWGCHARMRNGLQ